MEVRFIGPEQNGREVDVEGDTVHAPRMEWVDLPTDVARSLAKQDVWELRGPKRAAATRKQNAEADAPAEGVEPASDEENG